MSHIICEIGNILCDLFINNPQHLEISTILIYEIYTFNH